ncbi:DUF3592 domain-containing protein [Bacteroides sp.]|uniref:DUF3592 domain-containing protein n=1 Tax=Bacteroides sp. TaxID=29523 RepID=UPI0025BFB237|nr:DUF3592 domain-containing protein [Bacteroides sp.]
MKTIKKDILLYSFSFILVIYFGYLIFVKVVERNSLDKNVEYVDAVIVDFSSGPRMRSYLDYKFFVKEKVYYGSGKHYSISDTLSIGDTVVVVYDRMNPNNNKTYRDYK